MPASLARTEQRLPRQILERSAAIQAQLDADQEGQEQQDPANPATPAPPSAGDAAAAGQRPSDPNAPPPNPNDPADPRHSDLGYWKQRVSIVDGFLKRERQEHRVEIEARDQRIVELQNQVNSQKREAAPAAVDLGVFFTPEQVEELGEEQCRAIVATADKVTRQQVQAAIEEQVQPLRDRQERDKQDAASDRRRNFLDQLAELVPDFQEVDQSDGWREWLADEEGDTGFQRQAILDRHIASGHVRKVAAMFEQYRLTTQPPAPRTPPVAPRGSGAGPTGEPPRQPGPALGYPSPAEIKEFYKQSALNKVTDQQRREFDARLRSRAG